MMYPLHYWRNGAIMHEQASNTLAALCTGKEKEREEESEMDREKAKERGITHKNIMRHERIRN